MSVYITHRGQYKEMAAAVARVFAQAKISYWIDIERIKTDDRMTPMFDGLDNMKAMVVLVSSSLHDSQHTRMEISRCYERQVPAFGLMVEEGYVMDRHTAGLLAGKYRKDCFTLEQLEELAPELIQCIRDTWACPTPLLHPIKDDTKKPFWKDDDVRSRRTI